MCLKYCFQAYFKLISAIHNFYRTFKNKRINWKLLISTYDVLQFRSTAQHNNIDSEAARRTRDFPVWSHVGISELSSVYIVQL